MENLSLKNKLVRIAQKSITDFCAWSTPLVAGLTVTGLSGNIHTLSSTQYRDRNRSRLGRYVQALCLCDSALLLAVSIWTVLHCYRLPNEWNRWISLIFRLAEDICSTASGLILVAITVERYMAVSRPSLERTRNEKSVIWITLIIVVFSLLLNLSRSVFELIMWECIDVFTGFVIVKDNKDENHRQYVIFMRILPDLLFRSIGPMTVSVYLTKMIMNDRKMQRFNRENESLVERSCKYLNRESQITTGPFPLALVLLSAKFVVCTSIYSGMTTLQWLNMAIVNNPTTKYRLHQLCLFLLLLHSATNWLFLRKWQQRSLMDKSIPSYEIFNDEEKQRLTAIWSKIDVDQMGKKLLINLLKANPKLIRKLCPYVDINDVSLESDGRINCQTTLMKQQRIDFVGSRIGRFINATMNTLNRANTTPKDFEEIRTELRHIGRVHYIENVKITSHEWALTKRFIIDKMVEADGDEHQREDKKVMTKFSSFLIHEMKTGYMCEETRKKQVVPASYIFTHPNRGDLNGQLLRYTTMATRNSSKKFKSSVSMSTLRPVNLLINSVQDFVVEIGSKRVGDSNG